jgi:hypothetical protein
MDLLPPARSRPAHGPELASARRCSKDWMYSTSAVIRVGNDVPVTTVLTDKPIRDALLHQIEVGKHDLVLMGQFGALAIEGS